MRIICSIAIWFYKIPGLDATARILNPHPRRVLDIDQPIFYENLKAIQQGRRDDSGGKTTDQNLTDQRDYNGSNSTVSCYLIMGEAASEQRVYYNGNCNCFYGEP